MKIIFLTIAFTFTVCTCWSQQWVQTGGIPDGAGVTEIVVTPPGTILVSTASWSSISGTLGGVRRSTDDGNTWDNALEGFNGRTLHVGENGVVFASFWPFPMQEALYQSTDDGQNWTPLHSVSTGDNIFSITSKDGNNTIFIGTRNGIQRSTNAGANWSYINNGIPADSWVRDLELDTSSGFVAAATTNGVFVTTNNGANWLAATGIPPSDTIVKIMFNYPFPETDDLMETRAVYGSDDGQLYIAFRKSLYTSTVLAALFADSETTGLAECLIRGDNIRFHGATQFRTPAAGGGFWISQNEGNFILNNQGLPLNTLPSALTCRAETSSNQSTGEITFYLGSFGNAIDGAKVYKLTYVVGVEQTSSEKPAGYKLNQNYPNPFNPSTKISFDIVEKGFVSLKVFDMLGREVANLVNKDLSAGSYTYDFDASKLNSGIYFYQIRTNDFVETKRMTLIK